MTVRIITGDCRERLRDLPDESVYCVVTSPPYWGLRDYGTAKWEGGNINCTHAKALDAGAAIATSTLGGGKKSTGHLQEGFKKECRHCGAVRIDDQIGLEPTPEAFVAEMVVVFREVRRALRPDGTVWLNLGDSYATGAGKVGERPGGGAQGDAWAGHRGSRGGSAKQPHTGSAIGPLTQPNRMPQQGLKPKDICGIPWRVAFALQADGWWLRQDIIWSKPNPMPESVTDRCTKSHEYLFLLSKSKRYYFDADAIAEEVTDSTVDRLSQPTLDEQRGSDRVPGKTNGTMKAVMKRSGNKLRKDATERGCPASGDAGSVPWEGITRNKRSVWTVTTQPFSEAHFATFPPALIEPCILAGCPKGGTVLDPFGGAGTTGLVADRLGRDAILIELNPSYAAMAERRLCYDAGMFADVMIQTAAE